MSGITAIQALSPAETWEAWQALMQASLGEGAGEGVHAAEAGEAHTSSPLQVPAATHTADAAQPVTASPYAAQAQPQQMPQAQGLLGGHPTHAAHLAPAAAETQPAAQARAARDVPAPSAPPPTVSADRSQAAASSPVQATVLGGFGDAPAVARFADANAAVLPMAPVLMTPLALQNGAELRWRVQDAPTWRALFDEAGEDEAGGDQAQDEPVPVPMLEALQADAIPPWAQTLLARLRDATAQPLSAAALRPALHAWRLGLPVLLASPAGLASLQVTRDATTWQCRRWPARWRSARPAVVERWWAVRLGLGAQGRPRTLRDLAGTTRLPPGQVSCELRLDDVAPGIAQWADVLVQTTASPSLRALLAARPSLPWLLCSQPLWPQETAS